jgi:hypothetical protein
VIWSRARVLGRDTYKQVCTPGFNKRVQACQTQLTRAEPELQCTNMQAFEVVSSYTWPLQCLSLTRDIERSQADG